MSEEAFQPFWKKTWDSDDPDPISWLFFVVTKIGSVYYPISIASKPGIMCFELRDGLPIISMCHQVMTVFSSPSNHIGIRAEVALAHEFYKTEAGNRRERRYMYEATGEFRGASAFRHSALTDQRQRWEFPFTSTCLKHALDSDTFYGTHLTTLEPLNTVYSEDSLEYGMVVVDITDLNALRYGIVAFETARMRYITDKEQLEPPEIDYEEEDGFYRVITEKQDPIREAFSMQDFITRFDCHEERFVCLGRPTPELRELVDALEMFPIVPAAALERIWPDETADVSQLKDLTIQDPIIDPSINTAFAHNHLSLECCETPLSYLQELALDLRDNYTLSLCLDTVSDKLDETIATLTRLTSFQEFYFLVNPRRINDDLSIQFYLKLLATAPQLVKDKNLHFAGLSSAALSRNIWLSTSQEFARSTALQKAHFDAFPVSQVLMCFEHPWTWCRHRRFGFASTFLADGLLKPSQCFLGVLQYLEMVCRSGLWHRLTPCFYKYASVSDLKTHKSEIYIGSGFAETENITTTIRHSEFTRAYGLQPQYWTVFVRQRDFPDPQNTFQRVDKHGASWRYAFVRPRHRAFKLESKCPANITVDDFEVLDLFSFAERYNIPVDREVLQARLEKSTEVLTKKDDWFPLPPGELPLRPMTPEEVLREVPEFLNNAKGSNEKVTKFLAEKGASLDPAVDW